MYPALFYLSCTKQLFNQKHSVPMKSHLSFFLLFLCLGAGFAACKHTHYTAGNLPKKQIQWGSGGGFVGKESYFILLENGQIFKHEPAMGDSIAEINSVKARVAKPMFKAADAAGLATLDFKHPSNTYMFIVQAGNRVVWGDKSHPIAEPVEKLYRELNELIKK